MWSFSRKLKKAGSVLDERGKHDQQMPRTVAVDVYARLERSHGKSAKTVP
jgi:hypothetical protein